MLTFADMMAHLAIQLDAPVQGFLEGRVRTAVNNGWARLMAMRKWAYFHRLGNQLVYAAQTGGTVAFSATTRQVTLTGSTWPANATAQHIKLEDSWYPIYKRVSNTVIELWEGRHPAEDLAAGTTYAVQQILYPLPADVGDIVQIIESGQVQRLTRLDYLECHLVQEGFSWTLPTVYSLVGDASNPNRWSLWLPTEQTADTVLNYLYVARKPGVTLVEETAGEVSVASGVATFTDPVVNSLWEGAVLRIGTDDLTQPTGDFGAIVGTELQFNRVGTEVRVLKVLSSTTCQISNTTLTATGVAYTASSHIDVADGPMGVLLQRLVEAEYGTRPVGNHVESLVSQSKLSTAFNEACIADGRYVRQSGPLAGWYQLRLSDIGNVED